MDHPQLATTRRHVGELGVMSAQVERAERQILEHAERLHSETLSKLDDLRPAAMRGGPEEREYQELVAERGRLERVMSHSRQVLGEH